MKVLVVSRSVYPLHGYGGMERHVGQVLEVLRTQGVETTLVTRPPLRRGLRTSAQHEVYIPYARLPLRPGSLTDRNTNYLLWVRSVAGVIRDLKPHRGIDVIYGHGLAGIAGPMASDQLGRATCLNPHGLEEFRSQNFLKQLGYWPSRVLERRYAPRCAAVVATDEALVGMVQRYLRIPRQNIAIVPNAVELAAIDVRMAACGPSARRTDDRVRIVSTGRLEPNKGQALLVRAVASLPRAELVLIGDGSQRGPLAELISKLKIQHRVTLAGSLTDLEVTALYMTADIYCQPSLYEGSSIAVLEAMAHGLPVVASSTGGLPDKVIPGLTGILVEPGSVEQLTEALRVLSEDPHLRATLGTNARKLVRDKFSWEATAPKLMQVLEGIAAAS